METKLRVSLKGDVMREIPWHTEVGRKRNEQHKVTKPDTEVGIFLPLPCKKTFLKT